MFPMLRDSFFIQVRSGWWERMRKNEKRDGRMFCWVARHSSLPSFVYFLVYWALSIPAFQSLSTRDQTLLLEETLSDLLILVILQHCHLSGTTFLASQIAQHFINPSDHHLLKDIIKHVETLRLDQTEFTCLKALLLFRPGKSFFLWSLEKLKGFNHFLYFILSSLKLKK